MPHPDQPFPPPRSRLGRLLAVFAAGLLGASAAQAEKLVVVRSTAQGSYFTRRHDNGKLKPESYVFMPGHFFAGYTHDPALARMNFGTDQSDVVLQRPGERKATVEIGEITVINSTPPAR